MEKEFGKLTHDQFAKLVSRLPEVRGQMRELPALLREKKDRLKTILGEGGYSWGTIYERPFLEQMALLFVLIGLHIPLKEAAQSEDPQEVVLGWGDDDSPLDAWFDANEHQIEKKYLLWMAIVLQRNILSIMLYHKSMGALVDLVRQGDDTALFNAVRVDRSVSAGCSLCRSIVEGGNAQRQGVPSPLAKRHQRANQEAHGGHPGFAVFHRGTSGMWF